MEELERVTRQIYERFKNSVPMIFDYTAKKLHESQSVCYACGKGFDGDKVRDHCYYTGKYRGALHSECNLRLRGTQTIPVLFHNLSNYDSHLFVRRLADTDGEVDCIPHNEEKYITFSKNVIVDTIQKDDKDMNVYMKLKFVDTFKFQNTSLEKLVKNVSTDRTNVASVGSVFNDTRKVKVLSLPETIKQIVREPLERTFTFRVSTDRTRFKQVSRYFKEEELELLLRKQIYPYNYMSDISKFQEECLPPKEVLNKKLGTGVVSKFREKFDDVRVNEISDKDYQHAQKVFKRFRC